MLRVLAEVSRICREEITEIAEISEISENVGFLGRGVL